MIKIKTDQNKNKNEKYCICTDEGHYDQILIKQSG